MASLLFEDPLPLVIVLVATAVVLRLVGFRNRRPALTYAALAAVALAAIVFLLAHFVTTDREAVEARTRALVAATSPLDPVALGELIARGATVTGPDGAAWLEYDAIRPELDRVYQRYSPPLQQINGLMVEPTGETRARAVLALRSEAQGDFGGLPIHTKWELHWRQERDGAWRVAEVRWLEFQGQTPTNAMWR